MADRYWVGGTGTWTSGDTSKWSATSGGASGASVPTAADNVFFDAASSAGGYTVTIGAGAVCANLSMLAPASGNLTLQYSGPNLTVSGSIEMYAGLVYNATSGILILNGSGAHTVNTNGAGIAGPVQLNATGSYTQSSAFVCGQAVQMTMLAGTWNTAGFAFTTGAFAATGAGTRTLNMAGSTWTVTINNGTVDLSGTNITFTPPAVMSWIGTTNGSSITFNGGGRSYNTVQATALIGIWTISGQNTFVNFTVLGGANKNGIVLFSADQTITGTFTATGNSEANRIFVGSNQVGSTRTVSAAVTSLAYVDFRDIAASGAAAWSGTLIGDCLGNTGIVMEPSTTQTSLSDGGSFTWTTNVWTSRIPLPQDDVIVPNAFLPGRAMSIDRPRLGRNVTFTCTGAPQFNPVQGVDIYGSLTLAAGMTGGGNQGLNFLGRGSHTITSNGVQIQMAVGIFCGTYSLNDALYTKIVGAAISFFIGFSVSLPFSQTVVFNTNGFSVTCDTSTGSVAFRIFSGTINFGSSTITFPSWGGFQMVGGSPSVLNVGTSVFRYTDNSNNDKIFEGGGKTYNSLWVNTSGMGQLVVRGTNTWNGEIRIDAGRDVRFDQSQVTAALNANGNAPAGGDVKYGHRLASSGGYYSTPDAVVNRITGDLEIIVGARLPNWAAPAANITFISKWGGSAPARSYQLILSTVGALQINWHTSDGTLAARSASVNPSTVFAAGSLGFIKVTLAAGAPTATATFYTGPSKNGPWTILGVAQTTGTAGGIQSSTSPVEVGSSIGGTANLGQGHFYYASLAPSIGGAATVVFDPNEYNGGGNTWNASTGELWTINGNAMISGTNLVNLGPGLATGTWGITKTGGGRSQHAYLALRRSAASPANTFYAANSLNEGENTNWVFGAYLECEAAAFAHAGNDAALKKGFYLGAEAGAFDVSGKDAVLLSSAGHSGADKAFIETPIPESFITEAATASYVSEKSSAAYV
jgi:hypothetical protein